MDNKIKDKEQGLELDKKAEEIKEEARELSDEKLEHIAGGTTPIIRPF